MFNELSHYATKFKYDNIIYNVGDVIINFSNHTNELLDFMVRFKPYIKDINDIINVVGLDNVYIITEHIGKDMNMPVKFYLGKKINDDTRYLVSNEYKIKIEKYELEKYINGISNEKSN